MSSSSIFSSSPTASSPPSSTGEAMDVAGNTPDENELEPLFKRILDIFSRQDIFEQSPTFFVVYAHENENSTAKANEKVVKDFMDWFRRAGCNIESDTTPPKTRNIVSDQCCLLPYEAYPGQSVELVLLCGSDLLGEYMKEEHFNSFVKDMNNEYKNARQMEQSEAEVRNVVHQVQERFHNIMGEDFHHVQTEVALLKTREESGGKDNILLLLLNGDFKDNFPSFVNTGNSNLRTTLGPKSKYQCFFEILEKLIYSSPLERPAFLVQTMSKIYSHAVVELRKRALEGRQIVQECIDKVNKESNDWTNKKRSSANGVTVADVQVALNKYVERLEIRTVLGQKLDLCKYHIELEVSEPSEPSEEPNSVTLANLFEQRKLINGQTGRPNRIMIQGRPGIGKSTLSKQILREIKPGDAFTWILWIPLRSFERHNDLPTLIKNEYFPNEPRKDDLSKLLYQRIYGQDKARTLLILDGFDEVGSWTEEKATCISDFIKFNNVVVMSRFNWRDTSAEVSFDLVLKATGFDDDTITDYLIDRDHDTYTYTAGEIRSFMMNNHQTSDLVRAPMHLDLLWSIWDKLKPNIAPGNFPAITMLYQAMVTRIWCKDYASLNGGPGDERYISRLRDKVLLSRVRQESLCLGKMAIELIEKKQTELDNTSINKIVEEVDPFGEYEHLLENIQKVSFLRSDGPKQQPIHAFIHLTFQEFFAAEWLAENTSSLRLFIRTYKNVPRFETVLRFVSGLLVIKKKYGQLYSFFKYIEEDPCEDLGFVREQLIMRCFNETESVQHQEFDKLRKRLEDRLLKYVVCESDRTSGPKLASHLEFPQRILRDILKSPNMTENIKAYVVGSIAKSEYFNQVPLETSAVISDLLGGNSPKSLISKILGIFYTFPCKELPDDIVEQTATLLNGSDDDLRWFALKVLSIQKALPPTTSQRIAMGLKENNSQVRRTTVKTLALVQSRPPQDILDSMLNLLSDDPDKSVRATIIIAWQKRHDLPISAIRAMENARQDPDIWDYITKKKLSAAYNNELETMVDQIQKSTSSMDFRRAAANDLMEHLLLPLSTIQTMVNTLVEKRSIEEE